MIPTARELVAAWRFPSIRHRWEGTVFEDACEAMRCEAVDLARDRSDEPAAIFYSLARNPQTYPPQGRNVMTTLLTLNAVASVGLHLAATPYELDRLRLAIARESLGWRKVQRWFASRQSPLPSQPNGLRSVP